MGDGTAARAREELLLGEGVEVAARGRGGDVEALDDLVDLDLPALGEQVEHGTQAFGAVHPVSLVVEANRARRRAASARTAARPAATYARESTAAGCSAR